MTQLKHHSILLLSALVLSGCFKEERWYTDSQVTAGKALFETNCMSCHGVKAAGLGEDWEQKLPGFPAKPPALNGSAHAWHCLLYTSPSPRDKRQSRMPSSA